MDKESEVIAHYIFDTVKEEKPWRYEIKLAVFKATKQYQIQRRWYYLDDISKDWKKTNWSKKNKDLFQSKITQKKFMGYKENKKLDKRQK